MAPERRERRGRVTVANRATFVDAALVIGGGCPQMAASKAVLHAPPSASRTAEEGSATLPWGLKDVPGGVQPLPEVQRFRLPAVQRRSVGSATHRNCRASDQLLRDLERLLGRIPDRHLGDAAWGHSRERYGAPWLPSRSPDLARCAPLHRPLFCARLQRDRASWRSRARRGPVRVPSAPPSTALVGSGDRVLAPLPPQQVAAQLPSRLPCHGRVWLGGNPHDSERDTSRSGQAARRARRPGVQVRGA